MKILVIGAGVLGSNLARNFYRAKKDVTLLARNKWGEEIKENGLRIKDKFKLRTSVSKIKVVDTLNNKDVYDVIFVVLRFSQIDSIIDTLNNNPSKNIVFVGNNVSVNELILKLENKNVMFAFSESAGYREEKRVVSVDIKKITIGDLKGNKSNEKFIKKIFKDTKYKVVYQNNMEDYLLCHSAFVLPIVFACYKTDGKLKKIKNDKVYLNKIIDANIEGYEAIKNANHEIIPKEDNNFKTKKYRQTCMTFLRLMFSTSLGKLLASDHALSAVDEMKVLNDKMKEFFIKNNQKFDTWKELEKDMGKYL